MVVEIIVMIVAIVGAISLEIWLLTSIDKEAKRRTELLERIIKKLREDEVK